MNGQTLTVLLVEDSEVDARLFELALSEVRTTRFVVRHVERLAVALGLLAAEPFDVILSDLGLPDSRGEETFVALHAQAPHVPIIVLSGLDDEELAIRMVHAGAQDYLVKSRLASELLGRAIRYAIERQRIQEELRDKNDQLLADLGMAREFQFAFLPQKYPTLPRGRSPDQSTVRFCHQYRPSGTVGGDFFNFLVLSDTKVGVLVSDVMGHGVRAALVTAMIRGLVEEIKPLAGDPGQFLAEMNRSLVEVLRQTDKTMFATAFYMVLDTADGTLLFASAGHPIPLHLARTRGVVESLSFGRERAGPVLGLFTDSNYVTARLTMTPGDAVIIYTDGLFEALNATGEQYGETRLRDITTQPHDSTAALLEKLVADVQQFAGSQSFEDDVCVVGVELAPQPAAA